MSVNVGNQGHIHGKNPWNVKANGSLDVRRTPRRARVGARLRLGCPIEGPEARLDQFNGNNSGGFSSRFGVGYRQCNLRDKRGNGRAGLPGARVL